MRLVLTEYLSSLRERDELDVVLPNLLSQMGLNVFSTPLQGGREYGVDVAAVGKIDTEVKVYLFSIKAGDLDRKEWDSSVQSLRQSMNDIKDVYLRLRLPKEYADLPIVICPTFGGRMKTEVRDNYEGYVRNNSTSQITFEEWNGEVIAEKIEKYLLDDSLFIRNEKEIDFRSLLRKSLSMIEEPEISFKYFNQIINLLCIDYDKDEQVLTALRQLYLANGILFNWAKSDNNIKSALLASEKSLLFAWDMVKKYESDTNKVPTQINSIFQKIMGLYASVLECFTAKLINSCKMQFGLSWLINANCDVDVNLKLYEVLGQLSLSGLWLNYLYDNFKDEQEKQAQLREALELKLLILKNIIQNNPLLFSPYSDDQTIDLMLCILFLMQVDQDEKFILNYVSQMLDRIASLFISNGKYPTVFREYRDLYHHPKDDTKEYFEEVTTASILYPFIQLVSSIFGWNDIYSDLAAAKAGILKKCTFQTWFPDDFSEKYYFNNNDAHGKVFIHTSSNSEEIAITEYKRLLEEEINSNKYFEELSAIKGGLYLLILTASRHYRVPIPPQFFVSMFTAKCKDKNNNFMT